MSSALDTKPADSDVELGIDSEASIAASLSAILADTYRLMFKTHAYHWNVEGPLFFSVHKLTEEQYEEMFAAADVVAERIRALGKLTPTSFAWLGDNSCIKDANDTLTTGGMIADLRNDHERVSRRLHALAKVSEKEGDIVTADLATQRSTFHEKAAWMLRSLAAE